MIDHLEISTFINETELDAIIKFDTIPYRYRKEVEKLTENFELIYGTKDYLIFVCHNPKYEKTTIRINRNYDTLSYSCSCENYFDCIHSYLAYKYIIEYDSKKKYSKNISTIGNLPNKWRYISKDIFFNNQLKNLFTYSHLSLYDIAVNINEENILELKGFEYYSEKIISLKVKSIDNQIGFLCNTCKNNNPNLCQHQTVFFKIKRIRNILYKFFEEGQSFKKFITNESKRLNLEESTLRTYFNIQYSTAGYELIPKEDGLYKDIQKFVKEFNFNSEEKFDRKNFFKKLSQDRKLVFACYWNEYKNEFLQGIPKKNSKELNTFIKIVEDNSLIDNKIYKIFKGIDYSQDQNSIQLLQINKKSLNDILHYYETRKHAYDIKKKFLKIFKFSEYVVEHTVAAETKDKGIKKYKISFSINSKIIKKSLFTVFPYFIILESFAYRFGSVETKVLFDQVIDDKLEFSFIESDINKSLSVLPSNIVSLLGIPSVKKEQVLTKQVHLTKVEDFILCEPSIIYNGITLNLLGLVFYNEESQNIIEDELRFFKNLHPDFKTNIIDNTFYLHKEDLFNNNWFFNFIQELQHCDYIVYGQDIITNLKISPHRMDASISISSQQNWFEPQVNINFGGITVPQENWLKAIKRNDQYIELSDGTVGIITNKWLDKLKEIYSISVIEKKILKISKLKFNSIDKLFSLILEDELRQEIEERKEAFKEFSTKQVYQLPKNLNCKLRKYQYEGYQWLMFLDNFGFGGILADDMGLGKTIQVIVFLQKQLELHSKTNLVVVPKSILDNWENELAKFAPEINYLNYTGIERHAHINQIDQYDLIISTYDTISRDIDSLLKITFNYVILDESQNIKNPTSKRYKALKLIRAANKLAMTGTPIENNTFDLYAQFSFVNPGFFGNIRQFKNKFSDKIDIHRDKEAAETLRKMIYPFLLRRTKEQVAVDLPEKNEIVLYCDLPPIQRKMYETLRIGILKDLSSESTNIKFKALDGMLKLRKLCNSPVLIDKTLKGENAFSIKIETLLNKIDEHPGHKALIFSQFVQTLTLIRKELEKKGINYAYLDGSSKKRGEIVRKFEEDDSCTLFLISIKAGSTGLNLTAADYVYIFDPWWNPAVEAQAIDRTHRIGQNKKVFAFKLICRDTIEEKILELQESKKGVAQDLITIDDNSYKNLNKDDLLNLFN